MRLMLALLLLLSACAPPAPRVVPDFVAPPAGAEVHRIYVATQHGQLEALRALGNDRLRETRFFSADISVPPTHRPGKLELAAGQPDPARHFAVAGAEELSRQSFGRAIQGQRRPGQPVVLFVHGYNTNMVTATARMAQLATDYDVTEPKVVYAWPSSGVARGYVYDRDSVLFARDGLERLIRDLRQSTGSKVVVLAHSMGTQLTMEALRQMDIRTPGAVGRHVQDLILMAPDIEPEVFITQVAAIRTLPERVLVLYARQDTALRLSSIFTGQRERLGVVGRIPELEARGVVFADAGSVAKGDPIGHTIGFTNPAAMIQLAEDLGFAR